LAETIGINAPILSILVKLPRFYFYHTWELESSIFIEWLNLAEKSEYMEGTTTLQLTVEDGPIRIPDGNYLGSACFYLDKNSAALNGVDVGQRNDE
jgi:hypothetical protein